MALRPVDEEDEDFTDSSGSEWSDDSFNDEEQEDGNDHDDAGQEQSEREAAQGTGSLVLGEDDQKDAVKFLQADRQASSKVGPLTKPLPLPVFRIPCPPPQPRPGSPHQASGVMLLASPLVPGLRHRTSTFALSRIDGRLAKTGWITKQVVPSASSLFLLSFCLFPVNFTGAVT